VKSNISSQERKQFIHKRTATNALFMKIRSKEEQT